MEYVNVNLKRIEMYKLLIDKGKPYEESINTLEELEQRLRELNKESKTTDYPYFDVKVFDDKDNDISESQSIQELIAEIQEVEE